MVLFFIFIYINSVKMKEINTYIIEKLIINKNSKAEEKFLILPYESTYSYLDDNYSKMLKYIDTRNQIYFLVDYNDLKDIKHDLNLHLGEKIKWIVYSIPYKLLCTELFKHPLETIIAGVIKDNIIDQLEVYEDTM